MVFRYSPLIRQAFSSDGKRQTIKSKDKSKEESIGKVWRKELSFSDVKSVNRLYRCAGNMNY
jgi:hypothetical protein